MIGATSGVASPSRKCYFQVLLPELVLPGFLCGFDDGIVDPKDYTAYKCLNFPHSTDHPQITMLKYILSSAINFIDIGS
jgi:hypothetical protein